MSLQALGGQLQNLRLSPFGISRAGGRQQRPCILAKRSNATYGRWLNCPNDRRDPPQGPAPALLGARRPLNQSAARSLLGQGCTHSAHDPLQLRLRHVPPFATHRSGDL